MEGHTMARATTRATETTDAGAPGPGEGGYAFPAGTLLGSFERRGNAYAGWTDLLVDALEHDFEATGAGRAATARLDALLERLAPLVDHGLRLEAEQVAYGYAQALADHAVPLAYALARTAPAGLHGMADWLDRAKAFLAEHGVEEAAPGG
jgi:hypothetical protein